MRTKKQDPFSSYELSYMCLYVDCDGVGKIAHALNRRTGDVSEKVKELKKSGDFDYYRSLAYEVEEVRNVKYRHLLSGREIVFTPGQQFYLYHHIQVLGLDRGIEKVSSKLLAPKDSVKHMYFKLRKKQSAHQTAI